MSLYNIVEETPKGDIVHAVNLTQPQAEDMLCDMVNMGLDAYMVKCEGNGNLLRSNYGDKRDYRKIDIFLNGDYHTSTTWAKDHFEAKLAYMIKRELSTNDKITTFYGV